MEKSCFSERSTKRAIPESTTFTTSSLPSLCSMMLAGGNDVAEAHGQRAVLSFFDDSIEAPAVHIFHDDEVNAVGLIRVIDLNDVLMFQFGQRAAFALESL